MNAHRLVVLALFAALLCACGFHLRSEAQLPAAMQSLAIEGADALSPMGRDLRKALTRSGVRVVDAGAEPTAVLRIASNQFRTDVLSVGSNARANEYTIRYHVEFDVIGPGGSPLLAKQTLELSRDFTFDASQALGIAAEQDLLTEELQREMVQSILRRLEASGREGAP
jgi:LPS-assembly lipoprotein